MLERCPELSQECRVRSKRAREERESDLSSDPLLRAITTTARLELNTLLTTTRDLTQHASLNARHTLSSLFLPCFTPHYSFSRSPL